MFMYSITDGWLVVCSIKFRSPISYSVKKVLILLFQLFTFCIFADFKTLLFNLCVLMFIILHHKRVIQMPIFCWGNVHAISPSIAVLGVYFPTPKKKRHALYCIWQFYIVIIFPNKYNLSRTVFLASGNSLKRRFSYYPILGNW